MKSFEESIAPIIQGAKDQGFMAGQQSKQSEVDELRKRLTMYEREGYKLVPVNYECVWCGCTELDGWTNEAMIGACDD